MLVKDCFAIVSHTLPEAWEEAAQMGPMYSPKAEHVFLVECETPWQLNEVISKWIAKEKVDPWSVTVISCDLWWDPVEPHMCDTPDVHNEDDFDDYYDEHRYCGTQGGDRLAHACEILEWNDEMLDPKDQQSAVFTLTWVMAELLAVDDAYPGVDFNNIHFGLYPAWSASLHGGVLVKAS